MGPTATSTATLAATLRHKAAVLRMDSVRATSEAGSATRRVAAPQRISWPRCFFP